MSQNLIERIGKDRIIEAVNKSNSVKELYLNLNAEYRYVSMALSQLNLLTSFKEKVKNYRKSHNKDTFKESLSYKYFDEKNHVYKVDARKWCELLFNGKFDTLSHAENIKQRLIEAGYKENKCECCGISEWNGKPITLQIHHLDGNKKNNKLENLQFLCPNCHSQTDNYGSKNAKYKQQKITK